MAILDRTKNNFVIDREEDKFIGLKLPLVLDNGELASTRTTINAIKQNILNLCSTELGERVMQPNLGIKLKKFLFEPFSEDVVLKIQEVIFDTISYWLPFVRILNINVKMSDSERSTMQISVDFVLEKDPNNTESIQITIGE
jgi:phage baseplate assembly protein W